MKQFRKEFQNVQITVKAHGIGVIRIDTTTADPNQWSTVKELDFMIEDTEAKTPEATDLSKLTLKQLREIYPDIKATSKEAFLEQI